jgi:hypothetical protein
MALFGSITLSTSMLYTAPDTSGIIFKQSFLQRPFSITTKHLDFLLLPFQQISKAKELK